LNFQEVTSLRKHYKVNDPSDALDVSSTLDKHQSVCPETVIILVCFKRLDEKHSLSVSLHELIID